MAKTRTDNVGAPHPFANDADALAALEVLKAKGYTSAQVVEAFETPTYQPKEYPKAVTDANGVQRIVTGPEEEKAVGKMPAADEPDVEVRPLAEVIDTEGNLQVVVKPRAAVETAPAGVAVPADEADTKKKKAKR